MAEDSTNLIFSRHNKRKEPSDVETNLKTKVSRTEENSLSPDITFENIFGVGLLREKLLSYIPYPLDTFKILSLVNKNIYVLIHDYFVNCSVFHLNSRKSDKQTLFKYQHKNLKLSLELAENIILSETKLHNIHSMTIYCHSYCSQNVYFTEEKWSKLNSLTFLGAWNVVNWINIPENVEYVNISTPFRRTRRGYNFSTMLPKNTKKLMITDAYYFGEIKDFPKKIESICLENMFQKSSSETVSLPELKKLHIRSALYFKISDYDFPGLTHLTLGDNFDSPVNNLPHNLIYLDLGIDFNQSVDHLPKNLIYLKIAGRFDQTVDNLPHHLKYLHISGEFRKNVDSLPPSLTHLALKCSMKHDIEKLPYLEYLDIDTKSRKVILPASLITLTFRNKGYREDDFKLLQQSGCLRYLSISGQHMFVPIVVPDGVIHFQLLHYFADMFTLHLPSSIQELYTSGKLPTIHPANMSFFVKTLNEYVDMTEKHMKFDNSF